MSYTKCGEGTVWRASKISKMSISRGYKSEHMYGLFLLFVQELPNYTET